MSDTANACSVTASVNHTEGVAELVISDPCREGAWLAMPTETVADVGDHC